MQEHEQQKNRRMPIADDIRAILLATFVFSKDLPEDFECPARAEGQSEEVYKTCIESLQLLFCLQKMLPKKLRCLNFYIGIGSSSSNPANPS